MQETPGNDVYVTHPKRGTCVIINNDEFEKHTGLRERKGSRRDVGNLKRTLTQLGFTVEVHTNLTGLEMKLLLKAINMGVDITTYRRRIGGFCQKNALLLDNEATEDHSDADCFAVVILSHGDVGIVYSTDDYITLSELVAPFSGDVCTSLDGKPKLFFIQACRGDLFDPGVEVTDAETEDTEVIANTTPGGPDVLIYYSTVMGYYSWRNPQHGSWFVQALCAVLGENDGSLDLLRLLTRVNHQVAYNHQSYNTNEKFNARKQMSSIVSTLTKQLYFKPK